MLQANTAEGNAITLAMLSRVELKKLKEKQLNFYCPVCKGKVIMKVGSKVIPHFAHHSIIDCPASDGGEGKYHEQGKLLLYNWLKSQELDVELEAYISEINQRPDILLTINKRRIAIEYQCSKIPIEQVKKRNNGYKKIGIIPIWILGENRLIRQSANHFKLDQLTLHLTHQFSKNTPLVLYYFCPITLTFIMIQNPYLTRVGQALGKFKIMSLRRINIKDLFITETFSSFELYQHWRKEKVKFRLKQRKKLYGNELAWFQWLYLKGTYLEYLPSIIHLPIVSSYRIVSPTWNWQSRICIDLLEQLPIGNEFSLRNCEHLLKKQLLKKEAYPLIHSNDHPIKQYLNQLEQLNLIKQTSATTYQKLTAITFYNHIDSALRGDEELINKFISLHNKTPET
ncbi:hypothetical protein CV093_08010 [Oceanobacillus sp. 143]|uniref:Competence protein CoiA n=1 Tax=Oceanobacillus zhaokaii TaxID=2052660 RepID=A0A345PFL2_9BACI|nr:competence protein CoiA family protein [Oceanobacillus zhaokaii]AXI08792.1 hypothetical protein CUC15_07620 [Oceanobacillus zhaokaii]QGS68499.1 hypothetical protein CV093_08010 [Oceanobacillus sp. 143]